MVDTRHPAPREVTSLVHRPSGKIQSGHDRKGGNGHTQRMAGPRGNLLGPSFRRARELRIAGLGVARER